MLQSFKRGLGTLLERAAAALAAGDGLAADPPTAGGRLQADNGRAGAAEDRRGAAAVRPSRAKHEPMETHVRKLVEFIYERAIDKRNLPTVVASWRVQAAYAEMCEVQDIVPLSTHKVLAALGDVYAKVRRMADDEPDADGNQERRRLNCYDLAAPLAERPAVEKAKPKRKRAAVGSRQSAVGGKLGPMWKKDDGRPELRVVGGP